MMNEKAEKAESYETRKEKLKAECFKAFERTFEDLFAAAEAEASFTKSPKVSYPRSASTSDSSSSDSTATAEPEYDYAYSIQLFSEVAGTEFRRIDGIYVQTYGGGPEGGYLFSVNGKVYKAHREWFQPFFLKRQLLCRIVECTEKGYDSFRFRQLGLDEEKLENEIDFDFEGFKEKHNLIWAEAVLNYEAWKLLGPKSVADEVETRKDLSSARSGSSDSSSSSASSCSSSSSASSCSSSSSSEDSVCDTQQEINTNKKKAFEVYTYLNTLKCPSCQRVKF
jgi:hypothetical protein